MCHKSPQEFRNLFYSSTNLIRHTWTETLIQPPLTPSCHTFAIKSVCFFCFFFAKTVAFTCQFLIVLYLGVLNVDFNESCLLRAKFRQLHPTGHPWKSTNYLVELPQLPAKYLPFTAATGNRWARHRVTVHKPPDQALVSFLPSQSTKATVVVTVHGWRRGAEWWRCQRGRLNSAIRQQLTDKQWRRLTDALARCFPQWHHAMTEFSLKDVGLSVYQATTKEERASWATIPVPPWGPS